MEKLFDISIVVKKRDSWLVKEHILVYGFGGGKIWEKWHHSWIKYNNPKLHCLMYYYYPTSQLQYALPYIVVMLNAYIDFSATCIYILHIFSFCSNLYDII